MAFSKIDKLSEVFTRRLAGGMSRRNALNVLGRAVVAAPLLPLLPNERKAFAATADPNLTEFAKHAQDTDDKQCNYWRYCGIDGFLCSCCGGGVHSCPPGSTPSPTSWVGTCYNPGDKRSYLIAYFDCCGTGACGQCMCDNTDRGAPVYRPLGNNDIIWCFGTDSMAYHCSTAALVGLASE